MTRYHNQLTGRELLNKHADYIKKHKLTGVEKYNNANKPAGYYAFASSLFHRYGKDLVAKTFGWKVYTVPTLPAPSGLPAGSIAVRNRWVRWYVTLPRKEAFTVTDAAQSWTGQRVSNASMYLRRMAELGLLQRGEPAAEVHTGRPKFIYHRTGKWTFRTFNRQWSIAAK